MIKKSNTKANGSNGGHNGLGHIQQLIGQNYARLRMGIGNDYPCNHLLLEGLPPEHH